ncbi:MAG: RluA family pseudouridine synthase [Verrucomicrobia bacterium]|nr:RluA family pseudouridine synthase [Verrucomicrobiota bacterium]
MKPKIIELCDGTVIPILYEDRNVLALDKPSGWMLVPNTWVNTSRNLQLALESSMMGGDFWAKSRNLKFIRYIHRLDADASGILLMARNQAVLSVIGKLFEERKVEKHYYAVVEGVPEQQEWVCDLPLSERIPQKKYSPGKGGIKAFEEDKVRAYVDERSGKEAVTAFRVLKSNGKRSLIEALPHTGRTHQIRVHLQASGFPIVGDPLYGKKGATLALRAVFLSYYDSFQKKRIHIEAPTRHFLKAYGIEPLSLEKTPVE